MPLRVRLGKEKLRKLLDERVYETAIVALYLKLEWIESTLDNLVEELLKRGVIDHDPREEEGEAIITEEGHIIVFEGGKRDSRRTSRRDDRVRDDSNRGSSLQSAETNARIYNDANQN